MAVIAVALAFRAITIGASPWRTMGIAVASAAVSFYVIGAFMPRIFGERAITVGDRGSGPGGGFSHNVGAHFKKPDLDSVLASADRLNAAHAFDQFTCGDDAPTFRFELTLHPQGEVNERYVSVGYAENGWPSRKRRLRPLVRTRVGTAGDTRAHSRMPIASPAAYGFLEARVDSDRPRSTCE
jgi:hypothetical protein